MMAQALGLGVSADQLTFLQVALRAVVVCLATLVIVRVAHRRFLAQLSTFDAVVVFLLASMLARAVNGTASFGPTLAGGFVVVLLHRLLAGLAFRYPRFGDLIKGRPHVLVRHGAMLEDHLRANGMSREDVREQARLNGCLDRDEDIALATLERNGQVSIVPEHPRT
jgi:uncharacterized membrane protein YcaP (DUF421 family)